MPIISQPLWEVILDCYDSIMKEGPQGGDFCDKGCEVFLFSGLEEFMSSFTILSRMTECPLCQMLSQVLRC